MKDPVPDVNPEPASAPAAVRADRSTPPPQVSRQGLCLVLYDARLVRSMLAHARQFQVALGPAAHAIVALVRSGGLVASDVESRCDAAGLRSREIVMVDDEFFDFSGYSTATRMAIEQRLDGMLFINDTLASRHRSVHLRRRMATCVRHAIARDRPYPVLAGPYSKSEFSAGAGNERLDTVLKRVSSKS